MSNYPRSLLWKPIKSRSRSRGFRDRTLSIWLSAITCKRNSNLGCLTTPTLTKGRCSKYSKHPISAILAREIARQSMVLLKNDGLLPLKKSMRTLAVIGPNADSSRNLLGDYSFEATRELMVLSPMFGSLAVKDEAELFARHGIRVSTIFDGIKAIVSPTTKVLYARGCDNLEADKQWI